MTIAAAKTSKPKPATAPLFTGQSTTGPGVERAMGSDDFVCDLLRIAGQVLGGIDGDQARAIDTAVREQWGGDRPYIAKRVGEGRSERNEAIRRDHRRGEAVALIMRRHQVSRRTVYRVVGIE